MQIVVVANGPVQAEFMAKPINDKVAVCFVSFLSEITNAPDALFYLNEEDNLFEDIEALQAFACPVFVHSVVHTLDELPRSFIRINAWPGFLKRDIIEVAARKDEEDTVREIFDKVAWKYVLSPDISGLIAARIIATIINEAWFALGDDVSSRQDIDIAMKLGTNYPFGPFEWGEKIGLQNILHLLNHLTREDIRYSPAPLLIKEINRSWH